MDTLSTDPLPGKALFDKHFASLNHPVCAAVEKLLMCSEYASRHIPLLSELLQEDDCQQAIAKDTYYHLANALADQNFAPFSRSLRQFRHRYFLRLLLREYAGLSDTRETMRSWSDIADALILRALAFCEQELAGRYGYARYGSGNPCKLYVLAMGKLGGRELNYSSDIDLIFSYSAAGNTSGPQSISNDQYYTKIVQKFIQLMQNVTVDGFVFRVDLRLRPNGESGAMVSSLTAFETYYQEQGRDWERYAMAKARVIYKPGEIACLWFDRLIVPFVYRRYVDFSVIESLRSMKALILREIQINPKLDDIKRGLGGIREIEFIIQNIQLIRGGRLPQLRCQNAMDALDVLQKERLLSKTGALKESYLFLRRLENCLQSENDQQTHSLPADAVKQAKIALAMDYRSWDALYIRLQQCRRIVSTLFHAVMGKVDAHEDHRLLNNQLASLWQGHVESVMAINLLSSLGYQQADRCFQLIHAFRHAPRCRRLKQAARIRLDRFMVLLLQELTQVRQTESVLLQVTHLLENIVGRSAYLALLTENPSALKELLHWFEYSPFITALLVQHPFLLEVLLDHDRNWKPPSRSYLEKRLQGQLALTAETEIDAQEEILRQFKLTNWLLVARAEMDERIDAVRAGRFLADIAGIIVKEVLNIAMLQLVSRYPEINTIKSRFAMIAYGKLGSMEMNFNSDLDLVFVHTVRPEEEGMVNRLTQKIIHMLTARSQSGLLYTVDTRLRPSGSAGLLVSPLAAFLEYQRTHAWTWEHQALIRSRILYGGQQTRSLFGQLKDAVLLMPRDKKNIKHEVQTMRTKMTRHLQQWNDIKHAPGGLIDLEFLVQFLVLCYSMPGFKTYTNTLSLLQQLASEKIISRSHFTILVKAYRTYHQHLHRDILTGVDTDSEHFVLGKAEQEKVDLAIQAIYEQI